MENNKPTKYAEDQQPCIVAKKPCGCYIAAYGLDEDELVAITKWNIDQDLDKPGLIRFLREMTGLSLEIRPVVFVRSGGLNFDCRH